MAEKTIDMCVITAQTLQNAKLAYFMVDGGYENHRTIEDIAETAAYKLAQFHGYMEEYVTERAKNQFINEIRDYLIRDARNALRSNPTIPAQG